MFKIVYRHVIQLLDPQNLRYEALWPKISSSCMCEESAVQCSASAIFKSDIREATMATAPFMMRSRADYKNTPFDCGNDKKDMVSNSVHKDL